MSAISRYMKRCIVSVLAIVGKAKVKSIKLILNIFVFLMVFLSRFGWFFSLFSMARLLKY